MGMDNENVTTTANENNTLRTELAAAAKMLGDEMAEEVQNTKQNGEEVMEEDVSMEDNGEDLKDFIIDVDGNGNENNNKNEMDNESENINEMIEEIREQIYVNELNYNKIEIHKAFVNNGTEFVDDKQRYLLMNKRSENMNGQSNDIMNAFATGKYCSDQSEYSHSMTFKTDYNFICCGINSNGILPVDDIK